MKMAIRTSNLILPQGFVEMDREEMMYVDGGNNSVAMTRDYLNKNYCLNQANKYVVIGMTTLDIAKELYAHAALYYKSWIGVMGMAAYISLFVGPIFAAAGGVAVLFTIRKHANPCDLGGNNAVYTAVFNAIWALF